VLGSLWEKGKGGATGRNRWTCSQPPLVCELTLQVSTLYDMQAPSYQILDIVKLGLVQKNLHMLLHPLSIRDC